ncbi:unnamed protein product [Adineta steineri]|uniref:Uncharacterized protein n=1 Tax=Adineta steineri TaxID=433720 RepID=A0A814YMZ4_9BILA|nr:unnamed protein product [Adineta steineri]CAF3815203.1 unnamed protein product [Adineta steineri]
MRSRSNTNVSESDNTFWNNPTSSLFDVLISVWRKQRRKNEVNIQPGNKDPSPPPPNDLSNSGLINTNENHNQSTSLPLSSTQSHSLNSSSNNGLLYLQPEYAVFTRSLAECNIHELIRQPTGVDKNEWIANNIVAFFNHVNALYNAMCDFCTPATCPVMTGPQNSSYLWLDERNKKIKYSAPQYIDLSMMFIQKTLSDDTIFPTRLDQQFPLYFDSLVRKMVRLLFHAVAHLYAVHYRQLIELQLHPHLNSLFLHFISFLITSNIISPDCSTVHMNSSGTLSSSLATPGQTDARELRTELDTLDVLYQLLANQWRHAYGQACAQKRKQQTTNENI